MICDSRGLALPTMIDDLTFDGQIRVASYRGAGYRGAVTRARETILSFRPANIILCVGICDITIRDKKTKTTDLRYSTLDEAVEHVLEELNLALAEMVGLGISRISLATITGLDLASYNRLINTNTGEQAKNQYAGKQDLLNRVIVAINQRLVAKNKLSGVPTTWVAGYVHRYFRKHYHHYYNRLQDGCHLSTKAAIYWVEQIIKTATQFAARPI